MRVRLCLRERGGCFLFFFLFFVKLTHTFYYIDEQEGMFAAPLPSIPCPFIHPLHMCIDIILNECLREKDALCVTAAMLLRRNVQIKLVLHFGDSFTVVVVAVGRGDYLRFMFSGYLEDSFFCVLGKTERMDG